jgi:glycine oxidase
MLEDSVSVEVTDRGAAGREASWAGGGMLFPLPPWDYAQPVTALTEMGRALYPHWASEIQAVSGINAEYRQTGLLMLPPIDFERAHAWCALRNLRARTVTGADISSLLAEHEQALWLPEVSPCPQSSFD